MSTDPSITNGATRAGRLGGAAVMLVLLVAIVPRHFVAWTLPLAAEGHRVECAPDEGLQFWTVLRYSNGDLATWPETGSIYSAYPPAQYALHAVSLRAVRAMLGDRWPSRFPSSWWRLQSYTAARLGGLLFGCVTVLCAMLVAVTWCGSRRLALASGLAVALYPQLVFTNGYVNGDSYTIAAVAGLVLALSRWVVAGEGVSGVLWVGAAAGLVLLGKPTGYASLIPTAVWMLDAWRRKTIDVAILARATGVGVLVATPVLLWNTIRNDGDPLGLGKYAQLLAGYNGAPAAGPWTTQVPVFLRDLQHSAFGMFGVANLPLPSPFYVGALGFFLAGAIVGARAVRRAASVPGGRALLWLAATLALSLGEIAWNSWVVDYQPQGRYLLPAVVPIVVAVTCAFGRVRRAGPVLLVSWLVFLAVATATAVATIHAHPCVTAG